MQLINKIFNRNIDNITFILVLLSFSITLFIFYILGFILQSYITSIFMDDNCIIDYSISLNETLNINNIIPLGTISIVTFIISFREEKIFNIFLNVVICSSILLTINDIFQSIITNNLSLPYIIENSFYNALGSFILGLATTLFLIIFQKTKNKLKNIYIPSILQITYSFTLSYLIFKTIIILTSTSSIYTNIELLDNFTIQSIEGKNISTFNRGYTSDKINILTSHMEEENTDSALLTIDTKNDLKAEIFIINCILPIDYSNLNNGYLAENFKSIKIKNNFYIENINIDQDYSYDIKNPPELIFLNKDKLLLTSLRNNEISFNRTSVEPTIIDIHFISNENKNEKDKYISLDIDNKSFIRNISNETIIDSNSFNKPIDCGNNLLTEKDISKEIRKPFSVRIKITPKKIKIGSFIFNLNIKLPKDNLLNLNTSIDTKGINNPYNINFLDNLKLTISGVGSIYANERNYTITPHDTVTLITNKPLINYFTNENSKLTLKGESNYLFINNKLINEKYYQTLYRKLPKLVTEKINLLFNYILGFSFLSLVFIYFLRLFKKNPRITIL